MHELVHIVKPLYQKFPMTD